jgi:DNA-binding beta-propeller fold protein YncE
MRRFCPYHGSPFGRWCALLGCALVALLLQAAPGYAASTSLPAQYQTPNGWWLRPAGTQVLTEREPTGVTVAPDGGTVYTVSSGIFDEGIESIDAQTLTPSPLLVGDLWLGVAADGAGNVYAGGGASDRVYRFQQAGPALVDASGAGPAPSNPERGGTPVLGWPGSLVLSGDSGPLAHKLFVAGNLSVPQHAIDATDSTAGACPEGAPATDPICSVISVLDVSNPSSPVVQHLIPVGRDAYGLALNAPAKALYVANWADRTNPSRASGKGTVSVVRLTTTGSGKEVQHVPVGLDPTGIALAPDRRTLAVADTGSDQVTLLELDPATGRATGSRTVSVGVGADTPLGTQPLAVAWAPNGDLLVALAGLNAVEVLSPSGMPIPERVQVPWLGRLVRLTSPATYIPVGWYPDALAVGPAPGGGTRIYVANMYGMGAGPGVYPEAAPLAGSRTEGSLSAIDFPTSQPAQTLRSWTTTVVENDRLAPLDDPRLINPATQPCEGASLPSGGQVTSGLLCAASRRRLDPRRLHVVVIFNENKTFDSYFGDVKSYFPQANADPAFDTYPQPVTTNHHRIAEQFNLSDNFFNEGFDSSVVGHQFVEAGMATPYRQLTWAQSYDPENLRGGREGGEWSGAASGGSFDSNVASEEGQMNAPRQMIFDLFQNPADNPLGLTERVYSTDWSPSTAAAQADQAPAAVWGQGPHPIGGGDDETWPDSDRASMFLTGETVSHNWDANDGQPPASFGKEIGYCGGPSGDCSYDGAQHSDYSRFALAAWNSAYSSCRSAGGSDATCQSKMPNFTFMVLPQNAGGVVDFDPNTNPLDPTPEAMVADNDNAVGGIVQGLSRSPFWRDTAVLLTEDDTQATGDHVDVARTFLLAAGGLVRRLGPQHQVSHQHGSFSSLLRTTELLLGLPAMTLYDATAVPLADVIGDRIPSRAPAYSAVRPDVPFLGTSTPARAKTR